MKVIVPIFLLLLTASNAQEKLTVTNFQKSFIESFYNVNYDHLDKEKGFDGIVFYAENRSFRVSADIIWLDEPEVVVFKTTTDRSPLFYKYGYLKFIINGRTHQLSMYQECDLSKRDKFKNVFFIPFTDKTNGEETHVQGRYIDLQIDLNSESIVELDFNKAYQPHCAYNSTFSCPLVPDENHIQEKITAGVRL